MKPKPKPKAKTKAKAKPKPAPKLDPKLIAKAGKLLVPDDSWFARDSHAGKSFPLPKSGRNYPEDRTELEACLTRMVTQASEGRSLRRSRKEIEGSIRDIKEGLNFFRQWWEQLSPAHLQPLYRQINLEPEFHPMEHLSTLLQSIESLADSALEALPPPTKKRMKALPFRIHPDGFKSGPDEQLVQESWELWNWYHGLPLAVNPDNRSQGGKDSTPFEGFVVVLFKSIAETESSKASLRSIREAIWPIHRKFSDPDLSSAGWREPHE